MKGNILTNFISVVVGIVIALISGLFTTPDLLIPVVLQWGVPLPWFTRVISTQISSIHWENLILDMVFWVLICYIVLAAIILMKRKVVK